MAAFHLAVVADTQLGSGGFKQGRQIPPAGGEAVGERKAVVGLDTLHADAPACVPLDQLFQEIANVSVVGTLLSLPFAARYGKIL